MGPARQEQNVDLTLTVSKVYRLSSALEASRPAGWPRLSWPRSRRRERPSSAARPERGQIPPSRASLPAAVAAAPQASLPAAVAAAPCASLPAPSLAAPPLPAAAVAQEASSAAPPMGAAAMSAQLQAAAVPCVPRATPPITKISQNWTPKSSASNPRAHPRAKRTVIRPTPEPCTPEHIPARSVQ